jgi:hypothetical protein
MPQKMIGFATKSLGLGMLLVLALSGCAGNQPTPTATPQGSSRTLADFSFLQLGMSYNEVVARVGEPDRDIGSGMYVYVYTLSDGSELNLSFASLDHLLSALVYHPQDGTREFILGGP